MNTVHSEKLYTIKEASIALGVSIDTLLSWNHHNILKPTITPQGEIAYTKAQIDHFKIIRSTMNQNPQMSAFQQLPREQNNQQANQVFQQFAQATPMTSQTNKYFTPQRIIVFSALTLFVIFGITLLPHQSDQRTLLTKEQNVQQLADKTVNDQTSKLTFSDESTLPIEIQKEQQTKEVQNVGEHVLSEQITAPTLYSDEKTAKTALKEQESSTGSAPLSPERAETLGIDTTLLADTYTFISGATENNEDSAIDEQGNIRKDTLATLMGGIDDVARGNDLPIQTTDTTTLLLFMLLATGAGLYLFPNQLALLGRKPHHEPINPLKPEVKPAVEKVMEIAQKTDGTVVLIVLGREYKISKPEMNSESDRFIEQLMSLTYPDKKEIEYNAFRNPESSFATPLSRLVTRLGFVGIKRDLFFPRTSKTEVLFRKYVTSTDLVQMNLTIDQVLSGFKKQSN